MTPARVTSRGFLIFAADSPENCGTFVAAKLYNIKGLPEAHVEIRSPAVSEEPVRSLAFEFYQNWQVAPSWQLPPGGAIMSNFMNASQQIQQARNQASNRRSWDKVEQYLTKVEKTQGFARAWELQERLERGDITLGDLGIKSW
jgi:hypothetical protein